MVVIGDGEQKKDLQNRAGANVEFLGRVDFTELKRRFGECKALGFPGEEDFGIVPVEVMAAGRPVIAYGRGGALDTVVDGQTGVLFEQQTVDSLIEAVSRFETVSFDDDAIHRHASGFSGQVFKDGIRAVLSQNGIEV